MAKKEIEENNSQSEKLKALQAAMSKIEKDFGKGSIMKLGDEHVDNVEVISSGSIGLNAALGVGGYPRRKRLAALLRLSTLSMPSTVSMRRS